MPNGRGVDGDGRPFPQTMDDLRAVRPTRTDVTGGQWRTIKPSVNWPCILMWVLYAAIIAFAVTVAANTIWGQ